VEVREKGELEGELDEFKEDGKVKLKKNGKQREGRMCREEESATCQRSSPKKRRWWNDDWIVDGSSEDWAARRRIL